MSAVIIAPGLGARQRTGGFYGNGAPQLPGQRSRGICDRTQEVFRVLHLCALFHHAGRRAAKPSQTPQDARGQ